MVSSGGAKGRAVVARRARAGIVTLDPSDLPDEDADDDMDEAMFA